MKITPVYVALASSLLVNLGAVAVVAYRALAPSEFPGLPRYLELDAGQRQRWHDADEPFLKRLDAGAAAVRVHRDRLVRAIFVESADAQVIEAERVAIARLQDEQQRLVVAQLLREREILTPAQRERLAALLLAPNGAEIERLHRD